MKLTAIPTSMPTAPIVELLIVASVFNCSLTIRIVRPFLATAATWFGCPYRLSRCTAAKLIVAWKRTGSLKTKGIQTVRKGLTPTSLLPYTAGTLRAMTLATAGYLWVSHYPRSIGYCGDCRETDGLADEGAWEYLQWLNRWVF